MIKVVHKGKTYQFFVVQNAKEIRMSLHYYSDGSINWSFTNVFSILKREDIEIPDEVFELAKQEMINQVILC